MLIGFKKEGDVYVGKCSCGDDIYVIDEKLLNTKIRCINCLKLNKSFKQENKNLIPEINKELIRVVSNVCGNSDLVRFYKLED